MRHICHPTAYRELYYHYCFPCHPMVFEIIFENVLFLYRGINMRYLGKVALILSLRADLEHVHVSVAWCLIYESSKGH